MVNLLVYDRMSPVSQDYKLSSVVPVIQELDTRRVTGIEITSVLAYPEDIDCVPHTILMQLMNISVIQGAYKCVFPHTINGRLYAVERPTIERGVFGVVDQRREQLTPLTPRITENMPFLISRFLIYGTEIDQLIIDRALASMEARIGRYTSKVVMDGYYER